jgi:transposase InsO family protein
VLTLKFKECNIKRSKHSESEIIKAVKDLEGGISSEIICREHGISRGALYHWRGKYGGMEVSQIKRLRGLEDENGKPTQNIYIERFNGSYRMAVLDESLFRTLEDVREITSQLMNEYNNNRPHEALGDMSPIEYKQEQIELLEKI